ncbi:RNA polymerase primary sigma factor [Butyrivibrio proteoclasticus]|uniref:RNA polymerase primary sigma factor n=1 Tax=Butyrivibrio proteoclasticus TaxID=43305 RepID=A0A1I5QM26_9FIRM|nr:RNA polymerase sigma factor region1.1 domain-containing protein [Butyrivibrio proteoclasticus]SFP47319.1 RNA polymerase primary sigma factor [Butyrivibrio proteoclasticus]
MGNLENKEKEFAAILKNVTRTARENKNIITSEEVKEAFSDLELDEKQFEMVFEYLKSHKIGVDEEAVFTDEDLSEEEKNYLDDYIESLNALPSYTDGEKEAIAIAALAGEKDAQEKLISMYLPLVVDVARMYSEQGVFLEDLIGEGNVALTKGVTMLDAVGEPSEVEEFLYKLMLDAMENIIQENLAEDTGSQKVLKLVQEVADRAKELADDLRRKVTVKELMDETGWDEDKIRSAIKFSGDNIEDLDSGEK